MTFRYTICSYFPNPAASPQSFDFAVIVASEKDAALVGINPSAYGIESISPLGQHVIDNAIEIVEQHIRQACESAESGFDLLDRIVSKGPSSLVYRRIEPVLEDMTSLELAYRIFATTKIGESLRRESPRFIGGWRECPPRDLQISERHLIAAAAAAESCCVAGLSI